MTEGMGRRLADALDESMAELGIRSCSGADCLVVTENEAGQKVLFSTRRSGSIVVDPDEWDQHVAAVKAGRYDGSARAS